MDALWQSVLSNVILAGFLAVTVEIIMRFVRRPAVAYWLWLLVLLKLVTPPILRVPMPFVGSEANGAAPSTSTNREAGPDLARKGSPIASPADESRSPAALPKAVERRVPFGPSREAAACEQRNSVKQATWLSTVARGFPWGVVLLGAWLAGSVSWFALAAVRLVRFGRLIGQAQAAPEYLQVAARRVSEQLGVSRCPGVCVLKARIPPLFWWSRRRPLIVLPCELLEQLELTKQTALVVHELSHYRRGDHFMRWIAMTILGFYWWYPVVWCARRRWQQAEEECCDAWVVWVLPGVAKSYARTLLTTVEFLSLHKIKLPLATSGLEEIGHLKRRLEMILTGGNCRRTSLLGAIGIVVAAALVLPWSAGTSPAKDVEVEKSATGKEAPGSPTNDHGEVDGPARRRLSGVVRGPDGSPVSGAEIYLAANVESAGGSPWQRLSHALPVEERARQWSTSVLTVRMIGRAQTDEAGRFDMDPESVPAGPGIVQVVETAKDLGLASQAWDGKASKLEIRLPKTVPIHGRLLSPNGAPASGVVVTARYFHRGSGKKDDGLGVKQFKAEQDFPPYWPKPLYTDADGRFTLTGMPVGCYVGLEVTHPSYARDELLIDTGLGPTEITKAFEVALLPPTFERSLGPPRPVEGTVTEADTGKPMAGIIVQVVPMGSHGGMSIYTRTDPAGHFRVSDKAGSTWVINVFPPPDSGYFAESKLPGGWPAGAQSLVQDFKLERGKLIQGRVLDAETGQPIPAASVVYRPSQMNSSRGRPGSNRNYEYRNPILADSEGRFKLTGWSGPGYLMVEAPEPIYIRKPLDISHGIDRPMPMGYTPVDLPSSGPPKEEVVIRLQRGRTVTLQAVGPYGERLSSVTAAWEGRGAIHDIVLNAGESFPDGKIVVRGVDPGRTMRVLMIDTERKIGAAFDITAKTSEEPIEVRLEPTGTIVGQVVSKENQPASKARVMLRISFDPEVQQFSKKEPDFWQYEFYENFTRELGQRSFPDGRFTFENVLPKIPMGVSAEGIGQSGMMTVEPLQPNERRDVGNLVLGEQE